MEYAEAMSEAPPQVTVELSEKLLEHGAPATVELVTWIGPTNMMTRSNIAMGMTSRGFSKMCARPLAKPSARHTAPG